MAKNYHSELRNRPDLAIIAELVEPGFRVLDLGCGTGGISIEAAKKGYDVIGVDISVGMLNEARRKAAESGVSLLLLNQSMDELDLYGTVDFALCVLDGINHLDDAEMVKRTFERVSLFMVPGGAFAFDVNTPYKHCLLYTSPSPRDCS